MLTYLLVLATFLALRLRRYDIVHVHLANLQADVAVAMARLLGRPSYVKVAAGGPLGEIGRLRGVARLTRYFGLRHADAVQAISSEIEQDLRVVGIDEARIHRIPNGLAESAGDMGVNRESARRHFGVELDKTLVVFAGRMERAKGVRELLQAWSNVRSTDATLLLAGSPGLKDPVPLNRLPPRARHLGWTDRLRELLSIADVFVLPSHAEGMSNALLEAMAAGVAPISTPVGASRELIIDGETGILVDVGDARGLSAALNRLIDDPAVRSKLGARARERVCQRYTIDAVVDAIEPVYVELVGT
jgi:L-malate glycosyltransferase